MADYLKELYHSGDSGEVPPVAAGKDSTVNSTNGQFLPRTIQRLII